MKKVLFLIHDLGPGGAEKVLVNLVNNMDKSKFDITVMSIFDVGINRQYLASHIRYLYVYKKMIRGNSHIMKLFSPRRLHELLIKDTYDVEIAYLEGPCARIISGCNEPKTKKYAWIHIEQHSPEIATRSFRNQKEAEFCYNSFDQINCVSETVLKDFRECLKINVPLKVIYNTNESEKIINLSREAVGEEFISSGAFKLIGVGKLLKSKGFDRILRIVKRLLDEEYNVHFYILGIGEEEKNLKQYIAENNLRNNVNLLGYQTNPYKYVAKSDLFVCASLREGFSTAATEALIVGTPVCTVDVSGMKEMLGDNNEYGVVVPNEEENLYSAIKNFIISPERLSYYKKKAIQRGKFFSMKNTVSAVEKLVNGDL